jgi:hypothetical protein
MAGNGRDSTAAFVVQTAQRSRASATRPRMAEEVEARLDDVERKSAACYAELEHASFRLRRIADEIETDDAVAEAIPEEIEDNDSVATAIEDVRTKATVDKDQ